MPSGEHKNYDHVLTSNSTNTKHISGEYFSRDYAYIICFQMEIKQMEYSRKNSDPLPKLQIIFKHQFYKESCNLRWECSQTKHPKHTNI